MGKFNEKKTPVVPTAVNDMGEHAYELSATEELVSTCLTTFLQDSYYEKEESIVKRIINSIVKVNDPLFVAKLAIYLRHKANMRSVSHLLAGELAAHISGEKWAKRFYKRVYNRPDDMAETLAYVFSKQSKRKIPNAMRKAYAEILAELDPYTIDKYKMKKRKVKLIDLVNLVRPKPVEKNAEAYKRLMKGLSLDNLYENKTVEKVMSAAGQSSKQSDETVEDLKGEALEGLLKQPKGMPIMSLVRNLRNILMYAPHMVERVVEHLTDRNRIIYSRMLPFRFVSAYNEIEQYRPEGSSKTVVFEKEGANINQVKEQILTALETAMEIACENIPALEGNVAILIDHSGSVRGDAGGSGRVSAFSKVTSAMVGNLSASMLAWRQDNVYIGLFGDRLVPVSVDRKMRLLDFNNHSFKKGGECGGGTENGLYIFLDNCIKEKTRVDNLVIFSDMVIGAGGRGGWDSTSSMVRKLGSFQDLFKKFKAINPQCSTICVDIRQTKGTSVFDKSLGLTQVSGWSSSIFDVFKSASIGYKGLIEEINKIEI